jgi:hypothetical protein
LNPFFTENSDFKSSKKANVSHFWKLKKSFRYALLSFLKAEIVNNLFGFDLFEARNRELTNFWVIYCTDGLMEIQEFAQNIFKALKLALELG